MRLFLALLMAFPLSGAVWAGDAAAECSAADAPCRWAEAGSDDIHVLAKRGFELFRYRWVGSAFDVVYQLRRAPGGGVLLDIQSRYPTRGEIAAVVDTAVWDHVIARWRQFERGEAAAKPVPDDERPLCAEHYYVAFEAALDGKIADPYYDACYHSEAGDIAIELSAYLPAQVPYCARLPEAKRDLCFLLKGDRFAAADAAAAFDVFDERDCKDIAGFFAADATATSNGKTWKGGEIAAHLRELPCMTFRRLPDLAIDGRADGSVAVSGTVEYTGQEPHGVTAIYKASSVQVWRPAGASGYRIARWEIGEFSREP